ncbi:MAG TPA: NAD-dependent epimerase/dehydratase family protein, partial [Pyrinomonadaceae bacterium]|nr:NAD-dependent epimerase/dehydratase family protein [Pyrinomonadaceae bacterium]
GFIGSQLTAKLLTSGGTVTVFHRGKTPLNSAPNSKEILGERKELSRFRSLFRHEKPDVVVDMIAMCEADAAELVATFHGIAKRLVVISSADVYRSYELLRGVATDQPEPSPMTEEAALRTNLYPYRRMAKDESDWLYTYEKILVERTVMAANDELPATILRLPVVYGPGDHKHRIFPYLKRMDDGRPAILIERGLVNWRWTRGFVENVATAISCVVGDQRSVGRIYNLGERHALTEKEWINEIGKEVGWKGYLAEVEPAQLPDSMRSGLHWQHQLATDTSALRRDLGFSEPVSFEQGLAATIAWERLHPPTELKPEDFAYSLEDEVLGHVAKPRKNL